MMGALNQWPQTQFECSIAHLVGFELSQLPDSARTDETIEMLTEKVLRALLEYSVPAGHA